MPLTIQKHGDRPLENNTATWSTLPRKEQLAVLTLCRIVDYMQVVSFQTVCYYQLKSFDESLSEETLSWQSGVASGSFSAAQIFTSMIWGCIADAEWCGRKRVLLIGLWGTAFSCLGLALSKTFGGVVICRLLTGAFHVTIGNV
jgi:MFS family permease